MSVVCILFFFLLRYLFSCFFEKYFGLLLLFYVGIVVIVNYYMELGICLLVFGVYLMLRILIFFFSLICLDLF